VLGKSWVGGMVRVDGKRPCTTAAGMTIASRWKVCYFGVAYFRWYVLARGSLSHVCDTMSCLCNVVHVQ
jgi:hypothetical protein